MTEQNGRENAIDEARKGDECLAEARYLMDGRFYNAAVSRAYYAAFHWTLALLMLKGLQPKTHRGAIQLLHLHYIETGRLPMHAGTSLAELETFRELSDYNSKASFDAKRADQEILRADEFIKACRDLNLI